jgi:DNA excision repair protein ERCC-2
MPANKSALIAFPSYDILNTVLSYNLLDKLDLGFRQRIVETRRAKLDDLRETLHNGPTAIFCVYGGKFSEGIDLVQDGSSMLNLIIGVGIPYSPPTSFQRALQDWYDEKFGENLGFYYSSVIPSIRRVAQLIGRLQRSPKDWGVVILLDNRFEKHVRVLGNNIESSLWPFKEEEEMTTAIRLFIDAHNREGTAS